MFEHRSPAQNLVPWSEHLEKMAEPFILQMRKEMPEYTAVFKHAGSLASGFFPLNPKAQFPLPTLATAQKHGSSSQ